MYIRGGGVDQVEWSGNLFSGEVQGNDGKLLEAMKWDNGKPLEGVQQRNYGKLSDGITWGIIILAAVRRMAFERRQTTK